MVPLAKTGVGKSLLLCNIANYNRDVPTLFVTLEMTAEETYARLAKIYRFFNPYASDEQVYDAFKNLVICDENRMNERQFSDLILEFSDTLGFPPELVFVDYLGYFARGVTGGSSYEKTSNAVMQLKGMAKEHRVAMIAPHQVSRTAKPGRPLDIDNARDSGVVEETADFLISIYRPDDAIAGSDDDGGRPQPTGRLRIDILKSRHGNAGRSTLLQMGLLSLAIVDQSSQLEQLARTECEKSWQGVSYEAWLRERAKPVQGNMGF
jgi:replicative DNA helicase